MLDHMEEDGSVCLPRDTVDAIARNMEKKERTIQVQFWGILMGALLAIGLFGMILGGNIAASEVTKETEVHGTSLENRDGKTVQTNTAASYVPLSKLPNMPM